MEDRLEEAIHVLQRHAGGQGGPGGLTDMHSLLSAGIGGLAQAFNNAGLGLANRLPNLVRTGGMIRSLVGISSHMEGLGFCLFIVMLFYKASCK